MTALEFSIEGINMDSSYEPLPDGEYTAIIETSNIANNKSNTGEVLTLGLSIVDGNFKGRKLFDRLNIKHEKENVQEIAHKILARVVESCGLVKISDTSELHNKPLTIRVSIENNPTYGKQNRIKGYSRNYPNKSELSNAVNAPVENSWHVEGGL